MHHDLEEINAKLDHIHRLIHAQSLTLADIARNVEPIPGGMTPAETAQVVQRLNAHAAKLEGIAADKPPV